MSRDGNPCLAPGIIYRDALHSPAELPQRKQALTQWHAEGPLEVEARPLEINMRKRHSILCVDADGFGLQVRRLVLETAGYRVFAFTRPEEAFRALLDHPID